jgi:hypothetical protein
MSNDPMARVAALKKGDIVTVTVAEVQEAGIEVTMDGGARVFTALGTADVGQSVVVERAVVEHAD